MTAKKHFTNAKNVILSELLSGADIRTVTPDQVKTPCGITEFPFECELTKSFAERLKVKITWDCKVYGFVKNNISLDKVYGFEKNDNKKTTTTEKACMKGSEIKNRKIYITDCDDTFLLLFTDSKTKKDIPFYVQPSEVEELLNTCTLIGKNSVNDNF